MSNTTESTRQIIYRFGNDLWSQGDMAAVEELFSQDFIDHNPLPGQRPGREGYKQMLSEFLTAFPDLNVSNEEIVADGDKGVLRWTATGTHQQPLMGIPATGRQVKLSGMDLLLIRGGQITERWGETNSLEMMQQLGLIPS